MSKLKVLSGKDLIKIFNFFGFKVISQKGSYAKLRKVLSDGSQQTLTIPIHKELDRGTLLAIFNQSLRYILEEELRSHFYT